MPYDKSISRKQMKTKIRSKTDTKHKLKTQSDTHSYKHSPISEFKKLNCSPNPDREHDFSCYTDEHLLKMRDRWNARHPDMKINSKDHKEIWEKLKEYQTNICNTERCWLNQEFMKGGVDKDLRHYTFSPESPTTWKQNPTTWLNSLDITRVMKQYEHHYKCFDFIGPSPIDYDTHFMDGECVWQELCEFSIKEYIRKGKTKVGVIFNLDPHNKEGSHWVALFIHIKRGHIYYFDSYGDTPHDQISKFMKMVQEQGRNHGIPFTIEINRKRHQFSDSECGMYSLYFIIQMLKDTSFHYFAQKDVTDTKMIELRKKYFNQK